MLRLFRKVFTVHSIVNINDLNIHEFLIVGVPSFGVKSDRA